MADTKDEALGIKGFKESNHYEQVRPDYPREAVEMLMNKLGLVGEKRDKTKQMTVLELGAGTGKFTRVMVDVLKDANVRIIASDPVNEMCDQFKKVLPDIEMMHFGAEDIDVPKESVDAVVAASCFHWFKYEESLNQIHHSLVPGGKFGITWNFPSPQSSLVASISDYLAPFYEKNSITWPLLHHQKIIERISLSDKFTQGEMPRNVLTERQLSVEQVYNNFSSYSVVVASSTDEKVKFKKYFYETIEKHFLLTHDQQITVTYACPVCWFEKRQLQE